MHLGDHGISGINLRAGKSLFENKTKTAQQTNSATKESFFCKKGTNGNRNYNTYYTGNLDSNVSSEVYNEN